MKTVKQLQLSGLLVLLTLLSACQSKPKDGQTDTYTSGVIAIAADESFQPIVQEEIDVFEGLFPLAGIVPRYVTEVDAVNLLLKDSLRLAITSRRLTPEEMNSFNSRKFFPQEIKIATDGLALITHLGNPDSLISVKDIRRILTGDAKQWKDIYPASRLGDISLVFDNKNSSTVRFAVDSICNNPVHRYQARLCHLPHAELPHNPVLPLPAFRQNVRGCGRTDTVYQFPH
jgi:phosphate transport system substrate-binding protein